MAKKNEKSIEQKAQDYTQFHDELTRESDRGVALIALSMIDEKLLEILEAFFIETSISNDLLNGSYAPLGTLASRASAAYALGLILEDEYDSINQIRKIRNKFSHNLHASSFESSPVADLCRKLPWLGLKEQEEHAPFRTRFIIVVSLLLTQLFWRARMVARERRKVKDWRTSTSREILDLIIQRKLLPDKYFL